MKLIIPEVLARRMVALKAANVNVNGNCLMAVERAVTEMEAEHAEFLGGMKYAKNVVLNNRETNIINKIFNTSLSLTEAAELLRDVFEMKESIEWCAGYFKALRDKMLGVPEVVAQEPKPVQETVPSKVKAILLSGPCTPQEIAEVLGVKNTQSVYCAINILRRQGMTIDNVNGQYFVG